MAGAPDQQMHVVVLKGGLSAERPVSLVSGEHCATALREADAGLRVTELDVQADVAEQLQALKPDVCFNALHGRWGEDGCIQGLLEILKIPYTHSGVLASALAMDKERSKQVYRQHGLATPQGGQGTADTLEAVIPPVPYVIKPVNDGSSVGIYMVKDNTPFDFAQLDAHRLWMAESYIAGRELTVSVIDNQPVCVTEITTGDQEDGWYDYDAKYTAGGSHHVVPADIPKALTQQALDMAVTAHTILGCHSISRSDFRYNEDDGLVILETNTQPGMTPLSLLPEQALAQGMSYQALCLKILQTARLHV